MANTFTTTTAIPGFDGFIDPMRPDQTMAAQMQRDARAMIAELAEPVVYQPNPTAVPTPLPKTILAVVDRNPQDAVVEDGKVLTDSIELTFLNDPTDGVTNIVKGRDKIVVTGRYGGTPRPHLVTVISHGDPATWTVRCR